MRSFRLARLALVASLLLVLPMASSQAAAQSESPRELWEAFPLDSEDQRDATPQGPDAPAVDTPSPSPAAERPAAPADDDRTWVLLLALMVVGLTMVLAAVASIHRQRRRQRQALPVRRRGPAAPAPPPDPDRDWLAEIEWHQSDGTSWFSGTARSPDGLEEVRIRDSAPFPWPPSGGDDVQRMTLAADEVAASLRASGWRSTAPGEAWYAKRFAWESGWVAASPLPDVRPGPGQTAR